MKRLSVLICILISAATLFAQNNNFSYQAVIRDNNNHLIANQNVGVRLSLIRDIPNGVGDYVETHTVQTNANGLLTLMVGTGNVVSGSMSGVDWSGHTYYLKSEIDPTGGNNYTVTGVQVITGVPFAQYAANSNYVETQVISISNDTIFLSGGTNSFVKLPANGGVTIPDSISAFINNVGYITSDSIPTNISYFTNDSHYITSYVDSQQITLSGDTLKLERGGSVLLSPSCCALVDTLKEQIDSLNNVVALLQSIVCKPTVTTDIITSISTCSAVCGAGVTSPCGIAVSERGVCWNTSGNATLTDSHTSDGNGTGNFVSSLIGLTPNTTYYARAYAISGNDTIYGSDRIFITECDNFLKIDTMEITSCGGIGSYIWHDKTLTTSGIYYDSLKKNISGCDSVYVLYLMLSSLKVIDYDSNVYNTVYLGTQCWMKENLRTTHYANGEYIPIGNTTTLTSIYRYQPNDDSFTIPTYGYLYNWAAVMHGEASSTANPSGVQGICPDGWHVPSVAELSQLTTYVGQQSQYVCNNNSNNVAKALASTTGWTTNSINCSPCNDPSKNNATGFNLMPAGYYFYGINGFGQFANLWTTVKSDSSNSYNFYMEYDYGGFESITGYSGAGNSVRCLKD